MGAQARSQCTADRGTLGVLTHFLVSCPRMSHIPRQKNSISTDTYRSHFYTFFPPKFWEKFNFQFLMRLDHSWIHLPVGLPWLWTCRHYGFKKLFLLPLLPWDQDTDCSKRILCSKRSCKTCIFVLGLKRFDVILFGVPLPVANTRAVLSICLSLCSVEQRF